MTNTTLISHCFAYYIQQCYEESILLVNDK